MEEGGAAPNDPTSTLVEPLVIDAKSKYEGVTNPAQLDKILIQDVLNEYVSNILFFDSQKLPSYIISDLINQPDQVKNNNCSLGGTQSAHLYHKQLLTYFRVTSNQCNEFGVVVTGTIEYEIKDNDGSQKLSYDGLEVGSINIYGTLETEGEYKKSLANFVFTSQGQQVYLENFYLPPINRESSIDDSLGLLYFSDKGRVAVQHSSTGNIIKFSSVGNSFIREMSPLWILGSKSGVAEVQVVGNIEPEKAVIDIKHSKSSDAKSFYYRGLSKDFLTANFSKSENNIPVAIPEQIPTFDKNPLDKLIEVDARGSFDLDNDYLSYEWELIQVPAYAGMPLIENTDQPVVSIIPDGWGTYVIGLKAFDGKNWSKQKQFSIVFGSETDNWLTSLNIKNTNPAYNMFHFSGVSITSDVAITVNSVDINIVSYSWVFTKTPDTSQLSTLSSNNSTFQFTPDVDGYYILALTVTDENGIQNTTSQFFEVKDVALIKPKIKLTGEHFVILGETINILASSSATATARPANTFNWEIVVAPSGSSIRGVSGATRNINFTPDVLGRYEIELISSNEDIVNDPEKIIVYVEGSPLFSLKSPLNAFPADKYSNNGVPVIGDVDGNGKHDVIVYGYSNYVNKPGYYLHIFKQNAANEFHDTPVYFHEFGEQSELIDVMDFTGDGVEEIILRRKSVFEIHKLKLDGSLKLLGSVNIVGWNGYSLNSPPVFSDVNGDGKKDLIWKENSSTNSFGYSIYVALQSLNESSILEPRIEYELPYERTAYQSDGFSRLAIFKNTGSANNSITVLYHLRPDGNGEFENLSLLNIVYDSNTQSLVLNKRTKISNNLIKLDDFDVYSLIAEDINKDGLIDIIGMPDEPQIYFNVTTPTPFTIKLLDKYAEKTGLIRLVDINNDGLKDIVLRSHVFLQDKNLTFDNSQRLNLNYSDKEGIYDDFNNDGFLDAIHLENYDTISIKYFLN